MNQPDINIRAGGDPRERDEFMRIRHEINNINHPGRPEVNWGVIEQLSLTLFKNHGVDLQTVAYFTLARTQKYGLSGFTEGIELTAGLLLNQWDEFWPEQLHIRAEILEWLNQKNGILLRQEEFNADDLRLLYRSERALEIIINKLAQYPIKKMPKLENILFLLQNNSQRIEKGLSSSDKNASNPQLPPLVFVANPTTPKSHEENKPEFEPLVETHLYPSSVPELPKKERRFPILKGFVLGVFFTVAVGIGGFKYYQHAEYPNTVLSQQFLGQALSANDSEALRRQFGIDKINQLNEGLLPSYQSALSKVLDATPLADLQYGNKLALNAKALWPSSPAQELLVQNWEEGLQAQSAIARAAIQNYHTSKERLDRFQQEAKTLEAQKGKYMTLSYIRDEMDIIQGLLAKDSQIEALLYRLEQLDNKTTDPTAVELRKQIDERFNQLLIHYFLLLEK